MSKAETGGAAATSRGAALPILAALSVSHLLNDLVQSLITAIYPLIKASLALDFGQIGLITLTFQVTASLLQPVVGYLTDRKPQPFSLAIGMALSLVGIVMLSRASTFGLVLIAAGLIGIGSSVFHPESSRMARMASGGRLGFAQSLFQVGGNAGSALGPLLAALIVVPNGQASVAWFSIAALIAIGLLAYVGQWYSAQLKGKLSRGPVATAAAAPLPSRTIVLSIGILLVLIFSKFFYTASLSSYYTFYLIDRFHLTIRDAQLFLFLYLGAFALGTFLGGPLGDRFGRRRVILGSIFGALPFTLALPYSDLFWTAVLSVPIGLIISSAFSAILVFAMELVPGRVGTVAGLFFGFAFGMGGLGAALLGVLADRTSIEFVYQVCAFLPAIGALALFLPRNPRGLAARS